MAAADRRVSPGLQPLLVVMSATHKPVVSCDCRNPNALNERASDVLIGIGVFFSLFVAAAAAAARIGPSADALLRQKGQEVKSHET